MNNNITINNITIGYNCTYDTATGKYTHTVTRLNNTTGETETHAFEDVREAVAVYNALVKEAVEGEAKPVENTPEKPKQRYAVVIRRTCVDYDEIEASSPEEAEEIARQRLEKEEYEIDEVESEEIVVDNL